MTAAELADVCGNTACASYLRRAEDLQQDGLFPPFRPSGIKEAADGGKDVSYSFPLALFSSIPTPGRRPTP